MVKRQSNDAGEHGFTTISARENSVKLLADSDFGRSYDHAIEQRTWRNLIDNFASWGIING